MNNHKPATALPWVQGFAGDRVTVYPRGVGVSKLARANLFDDADYIAHSANAYPKLVEALRKLERACYSQGGSIAHTPVLQATGALLRELGEAS
jgi:hypothetical protein